MDGVKILKPDLVEILETNLDKHHAEYLEAADSYRKSVIEWYEAQLDKAVRGKDFETYYHDEQEPADHTEDYENVLTMLSYTIDTEISLTQQEFRQYVQDNWSWQREFKMSAAYYNTKVGKISE